MADVFISYNQTDRELARILVRSLEEAGLSVWWDQRIRPTATWDEAIEREIKAAGAVVVLWTPASVESKFVRSEATFAEQHGKYLPVMVKDCQLPLAFQLIQTINLPHLAILQGNLSMHPQFSALVHAARDTAKSAGIYQKEAADTAQRNTRKRARQQFLIGAVTVLVLGGAAAGGGYYWWNEQQNTRRAQVTALGAGLGLGQLKAQRTSAAWLAEPAGAPVFRDSSQAPPCTRGEGGERPCRIAWVREVSAGSGGIPEMVPRVGPGGSVSMETKTVAISGATDHRVYVGGAPVDFDFSGCAQNGACGITAVSGPRTGSMYDSSSIDVGLADGAVIRVYSTRATLQVLDPPWPDSPVTALGETGDAQVALRANGQVFVGLPEQRDVGGFVTTVITRTEANLGEWIARDGNPDCPEQAPLASAAQATAGGLGVAVISCDGQLIFLSRASASDPFALDSTVPASGRSAAGLSRAGNLLMFGPPPSGSGVTIFDPLARTVLDFEDGIDAEVGNIRGRLAAIILTRAGEVILHEPSAESALATIPLAAAEEKATPQAGDGVQISGGEIAILVSIDDKRSGWRLTDPGGPLINE
jgi:hypothetical protein